MRVCKVEAIFLSTRNPINRVSGAKENFQGSHCLRILDLHFIHFNQKQLTWELFFYCMCYIKLEWNQFLSRTTSQGNYNCLTGIRHKVNIALHRIDFSKSLWTRNPSRRNKPYYRQLHQNSIWSQVRKTISRSKYGVPLIAGLV